MSRQASRDGVHHVVAIGTSSRELWCVDSGPGAVGPGDTRPGVGYLELSLGFPFGLGKTKPLGFLRFGEDGVSTMKERGL
jgi:hypothetical protein